MSAITIVVSVVAPVTVIAISVIVFIWHRHRANKRIVSVHVSGNVSRWSDYWDTGRVVIGTNEGMDSGYEQKLMQNKF